MKILKIILATMSLICLLDLPYGYYQFYRFVAMAVFLILAFKDKGAENWKIFWIFSALLVQPFLKIAIGRDIWNIIDVLWAIILIYSIFKNQNNYLQANDHKDSSILKNN